MEHSLKLRCPSVFGKNFVSASKEQAAEHTMPYKIQSRLAEDNYVLVCQHFSNKPVYSFAVR